MTVNQSASVRLIGALFERLETAGLSLPSKAAPDWGEYERASDAIHSTFSIPSTTMSGAMRRLYYTIGYRKRPQTILSLGNYVGYCSVWLAAFAMRQEDNTECTIIGVDVDPNAGLTFASNIARLPPDKVKCIRISERAEVAGPQFAPQSQIIYIDVDDEDTGKEKYPLLLEQAMEYGCNGTIILLHDANVAKFRDTFSKMKSLYEDKRIAFFANLPIDDCGVVIVQLGEKP